jgi:hypothetical protein
MGIPMPEPPPPPPGYVPPPEPRPPEPRPPQRPRQEYHQRHHHAPSPPIPPSPPNPYTIPSPPQQWGPVFNAPAPYQPGASRQSSWRQRPQRSPQPAYVAPYVPPVVPLPPLIQQPQSVSMNQAYCPRERHDHTRRTEEFGMEWLRPEVPNEMFGLIGETLLCPLKVTLYVLGELFRRAV